MARRYGRCPSEERLVAAVPHGHWQTTTFIAGLRQSGVIAPLVLDGPMTGAAFKAYIEQVLAPALAPGDVLVMDNLAAHKVDGVQQAINAAGASVLYLPPSATGRSHGVMSAELTGSPDLNPIEQLFAKLKALLRKAAARTKDALWTVTGRPSSPLHTPRMRQLPRQLRVWSYLSGKCASLCSVHNRKRLDAAVGAHWALPRAQPAWCTSRGRLLRRKRSCRPLSPETMEGFATTPGAASSWPKGAGRRPRKNRPRDRCRGGRGGRGCW